MYARRNSLLAINPLHICTGTVTKISINDRPQLYSSDIHVQIFITFNDSSAILLVKHKTESIWSTNEVLNYN